MTVVFVAVIGALFAVLSYYEGQRAERSRVLRSIDTYIHHATRDQEEMIVLAARAIRRRVEDPVTFK